jgi:hypothetical protein
MSFNAYLLLAGILDLKLIAQKQNRSTPRAPSYCSNIISHADEQDARFVEHRFIVKTPVFRSHVHSPSKVMCLAKACATLRTVGG